MDSSIKQLLQPEKSSRSGFLGSEECFEEVVRNDSQTLDELELQHRDIAERLQYFIDKFSKSKEKEMIIEDNYKIKVVSWLGYQNCPWEDKEKTDKDYFIQNVKTAREICFSGLMPHLVKDHQFFEGEGTSYRLHPLEAILVLDIESPTLSRNDIEKRLFAEVTASLESQYRDARKHAIETLPWFKEREELPQYVLRFIQGLRNSANTYETMELWSYVKSLIKLGLTLPEQAGRQTNPGIYGLLEVLNKENDICGYTKRDLLQFKNKVEGTTNT